MPYSTQLLHSSQWRASRDTDHESKRGDGMGNVGIVTEVFQTLPDSWLARMNKTLYTQCAQCHFTVQRPRVDARVSITLSVWRTWATDSGALQLALHSLPEYESHFHLGFGIRSTQHSTEPDRRYVNHRFSYRIYDKALSRSRSKSRGYKALSRSRSKSRNV